MPSSSQVGSSLFLVLCVAAVCYFIPTIIAAARKHRQGFAVFALNLFFGWTIIGWIMCLVWSLTDPGRANSTVIVNTAVSNTAGVGPGAQDQSRYEPQAAVSASVAESATSADGDAACWDSLPDKNDPDCLEEYLVRFPQGRFAALATRKLVRLGGTPPEPSAGRLSFACQGCSSPLEEDASFCSGCGARVSFAVPA